MPTKKNGYRPPLLTDQRLKYVSVGCGNCIECRKQKARAWQVRLNEELKVNKYAYFVTLTFDNNELEELCKETKLKECNAVAGKAVRRFLERYRKKYKKSIRHWLITELGHENTERIHLHGLIFRNEPFPLEELQELWKYGFADNGKYVNERTINYIVKYVTKIDNDHKNFKAQVFCSAGLGKIYLQKNKVNKFNGQYTNETYTCPNGSKINLPIYYRNKVYTEKEREQLWLQKIEKQEIYVMGIKCKIDTNKGLKQYEETLKEMQRYNKFLGYGDDTKEWQKYDYNVTLRMLNKKNISAM